MTKLRVGAETIDADAANRLVVTYLNSPSDHYAYPAYDGYPGSAGPFIGPQDLFAPTLLNAGVRTLRAYYSLLDGLDGINERLTEVREDVALADADERDLAAAAHLFGYLDEATLFQVGLTKFAKIVHRKRPLLLPLWDVRIAWCYRDHPHAPVPPVKGRSWERFALEVLRHMQDDLRERPESWHRLARLTPPGGPAITALRALDIIGWHLGGRRSARTSPGRD
ncbi:DUF6308 family protein [Cellulomonas alba]|uniref:DUF6308 family protein n=1 Tax=Cellulomonas alba TaxID=3053467 RepID=A0ABT7SBW7_9CELL|nr:DUF6308 family protein [Cellulomonas alba]MDM7853670.1 DUF6308 family protein [Cellulomonas alba]